MKLNTKSLVDVVLGIPSIAEGLYHAIMAKVEVKPNKKGDGNNLVVQYKILDNPVSLFADGKAIENKGQLVCTRHYSLLPTTDYDPDTAMKELAVAIGHPADQDLELAHLQAFSARRGIVMVKVEHKPEDKDEKTGKTYPAGNDIRRVSPVPPEDQFTAPPI